MIGVVVLPQVHVMSMKEIVTLIVTALEVLYVEMTIVGQLPCPEAIGQVSQIAA